MLITVFSKDSKRGFAAGSNKLTPEKLSAGAITLAAGLVMAAIGGLLSRNKSAKKENKKKKPPVWIAALPFIFKTAKSKIESNFMDNLVLEAEKSGEALGIGEMTVPAEEASEGDHGGIEVVDSIPISSEGEVYEHI